ncbi:MAG: AraC family transcriptional regulator [Pseudomonadota bacterium]
MGMIRISESDLQMLCEAAMQGDGSRSVVVLPHGAGQLQFSRLDIAPGIVVTTRQGLLDKPLSLSGSDGRGVEIAFQLGSFRRVAINGREVLAARRPTFSVYETAGGQSFEIVEEPTRDAAFVEFSFAPGAIPHLCPALDRSIGALLDDARDAGAARLFARPLSPAVSEVAWRLARPGVSDASRLLAARRDAFALLDLLISENADAKPSDDRDKALQAADILRSKLADPPEWNGLADELGLSPNRLYTAFKAEFELTPSLFLRAERMRRAAERLRGGRVPLARLAWELGYRSTSHFVQAFRAWHGVTPARFGRKSRVSENDIISG